MPSSLAARINQLAKQYDENSDERARVHLSYEDLEIILLALDYTYDENLTLLSHDAAAHIISLVEHLSGHSSVRPEQGTLLNAAARDGDEEVYEAQGGRLDDDA